MENIEKVETVVKGTSMVVKGLIRTGKVVANAAEVFVMGFATIAGFGTGFLMISKKLDKQALKAVNEPKQGMANPEKIKEIRKDIKDTMEATSEDIKPTDEIKKSGVKANKAKIEGTKIEE